jgi:uncharacterized protein (DUF362 family)
MVKNLTDRKASTHQEESVVAIMRSTYRTAERQIEDALRLLDYKPGRKKILLKPNVVTPPRWLPLGGVPRSTITDIRFIEALLRVFDGYEITIAEGSASHDTDLVLRKTGVAALARKYGAQVVNLDHAERYEVPWAYGTLHLPVLLQTHEYINVPKLKTHFQAGMTLGCKNQKGLLALADKIRFHRQLDLHAAIRALTDVVQPALTIVDGIVGMDGAGPASGHSRRSHLIVAGRDVRAVDVACCDLVSIDLTQVPHLSRVPYRPVGRTVEEMCQRYHMSPEVVVGDAHFYMMTRACSRCMLSALDGLTAFWRSPYHLLRGAWSCILHRTDIITGQGEEIPPTACGRLVCYGDCTRKLAEKHGVQWIPGCPPTVQAHLAIY